MSIRVYPVSKIFLRGHVAGRAQCCSMSMNKFGTPYQTQMAFERRI